MATMEIEGQQVIQDVSCETPKYRSYFRLHELQLKAFDWLANFNLQGRELNLEIELARYVYL